MRLLNLSVTVVKWILTIPKTANRLLRLSGFSSTSTSGSPQRGFAIIVLVVLSSSPAADGALWHHNVTIQITDINYSLVLFCFVVKNARFHYPVNLYAVFYYLFILLKAVSLTHYPSSHSTTPHPTPQPLVPLHNPSSHSTTPRPTPQPLVPLHYPSSHSTTPHPTPQPLVPLHYPSSHSTTPRPTGYLWLECAPSTGSSSALCAVHVYLPSRGRHR